MIRDMSKRKKRRTRGADEDAALRRTLPEGPPANVARTDSVSAKDARTKETLPKKPGSAPAPAVDATGRYGLALLIVAGTLWAGWFVFLVYVAFTRP